MSTNISELLLNAGPEINDHVIALHHELSQLRGVLQVTQAQMMAEREIIERQAAAFEKVLDKRQHQIDSLREARRQLKGRVRQLKEGGPLVVGADLTKLSGEWGTHTCGGRPCTVVEVHGSYAWVLFHPDGRPRTRIIRNLTERPTDADRG